MKFSVVITCFNNSRFLPLCLDSALRNIANKDGEIVCVDDCIFKRDLGKILIEMGNRVFLPDVA